MATGSSTPAIQALSRALAVAIAQRVGGTNNQSSSASPVSPQTAPAAQPSASGSSGGSGLVGRLFTLERGVLQGSVLSPVLFLLIMDPLLKSLQSKALGPSIGDTYAGAFIHADDIRTISNFTRAN